MSHENTTNILEDMMGMIGPTVDPVEACKAFVVGNPDKKEFYSPNYPDHYPNHTDCIRVLEGNVLSDIASTGDTDDGIEGLDARIRYAWKWDWRLCTFGRAESATRGYVMCNLWDKSHICDVNTFSVPGNELRNSLLVEACRELHDVVGIDS
ncbi:hypothetical protein AAG570_007068 [Ranatra chinensis]|uniref:Uncharacterized protein n=1 Tax=Ranatra chinensis TaxID=642074 RepID=A0ABD0XUR3_9HEMI